MKLDLGQPDRIWRNTGSPVRINLYCSVRRIKCLRTGQDNLSRNMFQNLGGIVSRESKLLTRADIILASI
jgi:hypothetical protein